MGLVIKMSKKTCVKITVNGKVIYIKTLNENIIMTLFKAEQDVRIERITSEEFEKHSRGMK